MIQKNIFFIWIGKDLPSYSENAINAFKSVNPDFDVRLVWEKDIENPTDDDVKEVLEIIRSDDDTFLKRFYSRSYTKRFSASRKHATNVSNCLRWHLVNKYGGIYLDLDTFPVKPFDDFLLNRKNFIVSAHGNKPDIFFFGMEKGTLYDNFIYFEHGMKEYDIHSTDLLIKYPWFDLRRFISKTENDAQEKFLKNMFRYGDTVFRKEHIENYYIDHLFVRNWNKTDVIAIKSFKDIRYNAEDVLANGFVISIDDNRLRQFKDNFISHGLPVPKEWHGFKFCGKDNDSKELNVLGCSASHMSLVRLAKYLKLPYVCIFEDDAYPCWNIKEQLQSVLDNIPKDCELLSLGSLYVTGCKCDNGMTSVKKTYGSHAYILFDIAYDKYIQAFENDTSVSDRIMESLVTYATSESLFNQSQASCIHQDKWHRKLAFDLGALDGKDTELLANNGYEVISVEANPMKADALKKKYEQSNLITVENICVVGDSSMKTCKFYMSMANTAWDSCDKSIAERTGKSTQIELPCCTILDLFNKYGCPYYVKCDIEGNDIVVLQNMLGYNNRPQYMSCESECQSSTYDRSKRYDVINAFNRLGFTRFKLIDQYQNGNAIEILPDMIQDWITYEEALIQLDQIADIQMKMYGKAWSTWIDIYAKL